MHVPTFYIIDRNFFLAAYPSKFLPTSSGIIMTSNIIQYMVID